MTDLATIKGIDGYVLECPEQGLPRQVLTQDELLKWFEAERTFWLQFGQSSGELELTYAGQSVDLARLNHDHLLSIAPLGSAVTRRKLIEFMVEARSYRVLIGQSPLGSAIGQLARSDFASAHYVASALSKALVRFDDKNVQMQMNRYRALLLTAPAWLTAAGLSDLQSSRETLEEVKQESLDRMQALEEQSVARLDELRGFQNDMEARLKSLHDLYHKQIQTEAAAKYWEDKSNRSAFIGWFSFLAFGALVALPLYLGWSHFSDIESWLVKLTAATADKFSLTPIVAISIPFLAYGWILRHLSRVFIQNLALADDASYRRLMTMTFLGLNKDPNSGVTEAERAIILNALFRPAPPNSTDDGPPNGLLDLIKSKS